jgi:hypothetical protein
LYLRLANLKIREIFSNSGAVRLKIKRADKFGCLVRDAFYFHYGTWDSATSGEKEHCGLM